MAKDKTKGAKVVNKHLHARVAYIHQAAMYLASQQERIPAEPVSQLHEIVKGNQRPDGAEAPSKPLGAQDEPPVRPVPNSPQAGGLAARLNSQLQQVARKSQIRLQPCIKHASCKTCNALLLEGMTSKVFTENLSRGGLKPHADVRVIECLACGTRKRFQVGAKRQLRKALRTLNPQTEESQTQRQDEKEPAV